MSSINPYAPPTANVDDVPEPIAAAPALWNPAASANWSLLFTPVFGALLQMKNWQALGQADKAATSKRWAISIAVTMGVLTLLPVFGVGPSEGLARLVGLVLLIVWYYANGKEQRAFVMARFGKTYPRRSWWQPFGWAVLAYVGVFLAAMVAALIVR